MPRIGFAAPSLVYNTAGFGEPGWFAAIRPVHDSFAMASPCARFAPRGDDPAIWHNHPGDIGILSRLASWWLLHGDGQRMRWDNAAALDALADTTADRIPPTSEPQCETCGRILSCVGTCSKGCAQ